MAEKKSGLASEMDAMMSGRPAPASAGNGVPGLNLGSLDLSKVGTGELIPDNEWVDSEVIDAVSQASSTGSSMVVLTLRTVAPGPYAGINLYDNLVLGASSLWKFKSAAKAAGLLSSDGATFLGANEKAFVGKVLRHQVVQNEWDGRVRNKVKGGYSPTTGERGAAGAGAPPEADSTPF